jgi:4-amino-4-deoxychorismate lyase
MYPLVESIKAKDGQFFLLDYHQDRMERTFQAVYQRACPWSIKTMLPSIPLDGLYKVRLLYNATDYHFEVHPYQSKKIPRLKLVEIGEYRYPHKWTDRSFINAACAQREDCDDVLMLRKGLLTDSSYANIVLDSGEAWITPVIPLFEGVQRAFLLDNNIIQTTTIHTVELASFKGFQLINAMNPFDPKRFVSVKGIVK